MWRKVYIKPKKLGAVQSIHAQSSIKICQIKIMEVSCSYKQWNLSNKRTCWNPDHDLVLNWDLSFLLISIVNPVCCFYHSYSMKMVYAPILSSCICYGSGGSLNYKTGEMIWNTFLFDTKHSMNFWCSSLFQSSGILQIVIPWQQCQKEK